MQLPKHTSISIEHNTHKTYYLTIKEYIEEYSRILKIDDKEYKTCLEKNEIWIIIWYPKASDSCKMVAASTLERCIETSLLR